MKQLKTLHLFSFSRPVQALAMLGLGCLFLSACSPSALAVKSTPMPQSQQPSAMKPAQVQPLRVIVKFRVAVPYRDEAFLRGIAQKINARMVYLTSVSPDTHVYQVEPLQGQSLADITRSLSSVPAVLYAEADALMKPL